MKLPPDFEKFLGFIPEILSRDKSFLKDLESRIRGVTIREGDYLIRMDELRQDAYFISEGLPINQCINKDGNKCVIGFPSGSMYPFIPTIGYFTQVPSELEVKAIEDGELPCFSRMDIERLSLRYPILATCYQNVMLIIISKLYSMFVVRQTYKAEEFLKYLYTDH